MHNIVKTRNKNLSTHTYNFSNRFTNLLMKGGKKSSAFRLLLSSITKCKLSSIDTILLKNKKRLKSQFIYEQVINKVKSSVEVRKVRVGGGLYQVPSITQVRRQEGTAIRWIIKSTANRKKTNNRIFSECLGQEFLDCIKSESESTQKRDQMHLLAASNRAYTRFRWW